MIANEYTSDALLYLLRKASGALYAKVPPLIPVRMVVAKVVLEIPVARPKSAT